MTVEYKLVLIHIQKMRFAEQICHTQKHKLHNVHVHVHSQNSICMVSLISQEKLTGDERILLH
jgi:hypothetical protein